MSAPPYPAAPLLIVDDEQAFLHSAEFLLAAEGLHNVVLCPDSRQVMTLLGGREFSVVLLDLSMPHVSGHELLPRIVEEHPERGVGTGGYFVNNVVVFASSRLRGFVDVGPRSRPATFTFGWNLWYAVDDESFAGPEYTDGLPAETNAIVGRNPLLDATRRPQVGSPALTSGREVPGGAVPDFDRRPYGSPPNRGAFSRP